MLPPAFSTSLEGSTALVTGASSGLGRRFAEVLAASGARVAVTGRRLDKLEALAEAIQARGGVAEPIVLDMTRTGTFGAVVDSIERSLGTIDILINNAGIADGNYATRLDHALMNTIIDTNLAAPFSLACEVARRLITKHQPGRIVNIASMLAFDYGPASAASLYSVTKAGVARMTEVLALEWAAFNINVNAIAPGLFASEMTDGMIGRIGGEIVNEFPRKRIGQPRDLDSALLFLVSPSSTFVTGTIVKVDDGQGRR